MYSHELLDFITCIYSEKDTHNIKLLYTYLLFIMTMKVIKIRLFMKNPYYFELRYCHSAQPQPVIPFTLQL